LTIGSRSNIGNARLAGLEADLGMTANMYNAALAYFVRIFHALRIVLICSQYIVSGAKVSVGRA
jgi:hypothetical protein